MLVYSKRAFIFIMYKHISFHCIWLVWRKKCWWYYIFVPDFQL